MPGRVRTPPSASAGIDIATTIGTKDQRVPPGLVEKREPLDSEELLDELIATSRREAIVDQQLEQDILDGVENPSPGHSPTHSKGPEDENGKKLVLVPTVVRDIKADVAMPRRKRVLRRSATSSLALEDDKRLRELARPIEPVLSATDDDEMARRFTDKLHQCSMPLDQIVNLNPSTGAEVRRSSLEELVEVLEGSQQSVFLTDKNLPDILRLVKANLFRDLPDCPRVIPFEEYDPEDVINTEWDSLNNVYKIIFRVLCHRFEDPEQLAKLWDVKAMKKLVALLLDNVLDARERRFAKIVLHRTYAKIRAIRDPLRQIIGNAFANFAYEPECMPLKGPAGIAELLEIYSSLVQGFKFPVKPGHINFAKRYLLPLVKVPMLYFSWFKISLLECFKHLVHKQPTLTDDILTYFFRYWPWLSHKKQLAMLIFVEAILDTTWLQTDVIKVVAPKLLKFLQRLMSTQNYTVIEASFSLWENDHLVTSIWEAFNAQAMAALKRPLMALGKPEVYSMEVRYNSAGVLELLEDLSTMSL